MKTLHTRLITAVLISATGSIAGSQEMPNGNMDMKNGEMMTGCCRGESKDQPAMDPQ